MAVIESMRPNLLGMGEFVYVDGTHLRVTEIAESHTDPVYYRYTLVKTA
jgi:hypothetical protein